MITEQETPKTMSQQLSAEQMASKRRNAALKALMVATKNLTDSVDWEESHPCDPSAEWSVDYATDGVENAAKELVAAVNMLPDRELPIGWKEIAL